MITPKSELYFNIRLQFSFLSYSFFFYVQLITYRIINTFVRKMTASADAEKQLDLLDEVWAKVFEYLPVEDRTSVRLTCRRFYEIANCPGLQKSEQIILSADFYVDAALGLLATSRRKVWNLKFDGVNLRDDSAVLSFFQRQGINVYSLVFEGGTIAPELLRYIILQCVNLHSLALYPNSFDNRRYNHRSLRLDHVLSEFGPLRNDGIIRQHVHSLTLDLRMFKYVITNDQFHDVFAVFPNIKELSLECELADDVPPASSKKPARLSFSGLFKQLLETRHQIEALSLNLFFKGVKDQSDITHKWKMISLLEMEKLEEVSLYEFHILDASNPILSFKHLNEFKCHISDPILEKISGSDFIQLVLYTAPELYSLSIQAKSSISLTKECFQALVRSRLRYLDFLTDIIFDFEPLSLKNCCHPNRTLKDFLIQNNLESYSNIFLTYFHCLETLIVEYISNDIFSNIFQHQLRLRYLKIVGSPADHLFLRNTNSLSGQHNYLTHLYMTEMTSLQLCEFFLIRFPKLKALSIIFSRVNNKDSSIVDLLWQRIQKLTDLEYLEIDRGIEISSVQLSYLCSILTRLRYFIYFSNGCKPFGIQFYHQLLLDCPSLRMVIHRNQKASLNVKYFKDISTNSVISLGNVNADNIYDGIPQKYYPFS